ncbi:Trp biosynthesis-associated membrane protein [Actinoplanes sp. NPDC089786]|uniref:Trp biosynthesis-associated membrane protein n=1 Tax=Actinoplanes sp. NPDC089786 TaxID=3155185 RepID=UPI00343D81E8
MTEPAASAEPTASEPPATPDNEARDDQARDDEARDKEAGSGGRGLAAAVLGCVAGAGLAIFAATRVWAVAVTERPGLPELREQTTGAAAQGWIIALAVVALGGAGALLATRGGLRRGLGVLLMPVGAGLAVAAIAARSGLDVGAAGAGSIVWPAVCVIGSALIVLGGLGAARRGHRWPAMGSRYERGTAPSPLAQPGGPSEPSAAAGLKPDVTATDTRAAWDALDRGDDPTA